VCIFCDNSLASDNCTLELVATLLKDIKHRCNFSVRDKERGRNRDKENMRDREVD